MKKKLCALALCVIMVVALAVPAFAAVPIESTGSLYAWRGTMTADGKAGLVNNGSNQILSVKGGTSSSWTLQKAPSGTGLVLKTPGGLCVNIYRVNQGGYYNATAYPFDTADRGRDQRINANNDIYADGTAFQLVEPNLNAGGNWYLCTDASNPVSSTIAIWYNGLMTDRFFWNR